MHNLARRSHPMGVMTRGEKRPIIWRMRLSNKVLDRLLVDALRSQWPALAFGSQSCKNGEAIMAHGAVVAQHCICWFIPLRPATC